MSEPNYKVKASDLDRTTVAGATNKEMEYAKERAHLPLKAKYRPKRGSLPQWGTGGDRSGKGRPRANRQPQVDTGMRRVMVVSYGGRKRMTWEPTS